MCLGSKASNAKVFVLVAVMVEVSDCANVCARPDKQKESCHVWACTHDVDRMLLSVGRCDYCVGLDGLRLNQLLCVCFMHGVWSEVVAVMHVCRGVCGDV